MAIDQVTKDQIEKSHRTALLLGSVMLIATFSYPVLANVIRHYKSFQAGLPISYSTMLRCILIGFSLIGAIAVKKSYSRTLSAEGNFSDEVSVEINKHRLISRFLTSSVVSFGFSHILASFGFILFLLTRNFNDVFLFLAISVISFVVSIPRLGSWESQFDSLWNKFRIQMPQIQNQQKQVNSDPSYPRIYTASIVGIVNIALPYSLGILALLVMASVPLWAKASEVSTLSICWSIVEGGAALFILYSLVRAYYKARFVIYEDRIKYVGFFTVKELLVEDVAGFIIRSSYYSGVRIKFYSKKSNYEVLTAKLIFKNQDVLLEWIKETFADLDEKNYKEELETIIHEKPIEFTPSSAVAMTGLTERQRIDKLDQVRNWVLVFNIFVGAAIFWGFFIPWPYKFIIGMLFLLPFIAIFYLYRFAGLIKLWSRKKSAYPIIWGFAFPCFVLAWRALQDWEILGWQSFWLPFVSFSLVLFLGLIFFSPDVRKATGTAMIWLLICMLFGYGSAITLNGILDSSSPTIYRAEIINKHKHVGRNAAYYLTLSPWGARNKAKDVTVSESQYDKYKIRDSVEVGVHAGAFRIPWFGVEE